jgi:hypothetical protein
MTRANAAIASAEELLRDVEKLLARCGSLADACRLLLAGDLQSTEPDRASATLDKLNQSLDQAAEIEQRCDDLGDLCRVAWQDALRGGGLTALSDTLDDLNQMLEHGKKLDAACNEADLRCAATWRLVFAQTGDTNQVSQYMEQVEAALLALREAADKSQHDLDRLRGPFGALLDTNAPELLADARRSLEAGEAMQAKLLAEEALAAHPGLRLSWPLGLAAALMLTLLAGVVVWRRRWAALRTQPVAQPLRMRQLKPQPIAQPHRQRHATPSPDDELLAELLAWPPEAKQQQTTNIKKAA